MNQFAYAGRVRRPRPVTMAAALLGSVTALISLMLPWWSAAGRSATPTANGLFPLLTMSLVVLAVVGMDVATRMLRDSGTAPHALAAVAIAFLAVVGISFHVLAGWGAAARGAGQLTALIAATLVLTTTTLGLSASGPPRPVHPAVPTGYPTMPQQPPVPVMPQQPPVQVMPQQPPVPVMPQQPPTAPVMPQQPPVPVMPQQPPVQAMPQQPPTAPSDSFWFHVMNTEPLVGPDGVNAVSMLQPGRWYLAVGLAPGWVVAQDENGQTGYVHPEKIVRAAR